MFKTKRLLISMLTLFCCCTGAWAQSSSDVLNGVFTINNSGTKVQFSKGNLQYVNGTYQFAEHLYDYSGNYQEWFSYNNYSAPNDGISWYVLSQAEWAYLFVSRTVTNTLSEGARYSKATIGGTYKGVIVFPDNYTHPEGTGFTGNCENAEEAYTSTVSLEGWALMEAAGCVFLPAAGYSTASSQVHLAAIYQSTTRADGSYNYTPGFYNNKISMYDTSYTSTGVSVRFVKQYELPQDSEGYYLLGSVQDWKDFAEMVNRGTNTAVNAKMTADIDLGDDQTKIGIVDSKYYSGTFDGQGYTLTIRYVHDPSKYVDAPFLHINNATIKNIHIAGTINSEDSQPAPIGLCKGTNTIENLWSSLVINCTPSGTKWQETSAIVGLVQDGSLTIRDCIYTGSNTSTGSYNGCFVGYINSGGSATITNCLSVGEFNYSGSSSGFRGTHTNCYVKQFPATYPAGVTQTTDATLADGTIAYNLQADRADLVWGQRIGIDSEPVLTNDESYRVYKSKNGGYTNDPTQAYEGLQQDTDGNYLIGSVMDWKEFAELINTTPTANAKMTEDIDLGDDQTRIGSTSDSNTALHYKGIFDGQGHTLKISFAETGGSNLCAPFNKLDGATIKNLHITGTIHTAGIHGAGVASDARGTTTIENVWSEVDVTSTHSGWDECSGIVGCMKAGSLTISDCLFSGSVTASSSYNGGFIGYRDNGSASIVNCLSTGTFNYSSGSYQDFARGASVSNSYYTQFVGSTTGMTLTTTEQLADGTTATALQVGRTEEVWVQDPLTNQPMLKTFATVAYKVPSSGVGTFSSKAKFVVPEGLTAYYCKTYNAANGTISVVPIDGNVVPANTGVVLRGTGGDTYTLTGTNSEAATITDNALVAVTEATHVDQVSGNYTNFMMSGGKFIKIAASNDPDVKMPANRAYLQILTSQITGSQAIQLWWDDETTSLNSIENGKLIMDNDVWYTLDGRLVANGQSQLPRGIYIHNGKKVVIK